MNDLYLGDGIIGLWCLPQHSVDMLLTDPPYGTTRNPWDVPLPLPEFWEAVRWAVKPNGAILLFAQCPYDKILGASNLKMLRYEWVWVKAINNYVKLRDIGKAVGFNVYFQDGVQVDSKASYTGEAPASVQATAQKPASASAEAVRVNCYKDGPLNIGEGSALMIYPSGMEYTVVSDNPAVATVEQVTGFWKVNTLSPGKATITATAPDGRFGKVVILVEAGGQPQSSEIGWNKGASIDLTANMEIRQEMIRLINQSRRANGVGELTVNKALMDAAQDCSAQMFRTHHTEYECKAAIGFLNATLDGCFFGRVAAHGIRGLHTATITQGGATDKEVQRLRDSIFRGLDVPMFPIKQRPARDRRKKAPAPER